MRWLVALSLLVLVAAVAFALWPGGPASSSLILERPGPAPLPPVVPVAPPTPVTVIATPQPPPRPPVEAPPPVALAAPPPALEEPAIDHDHLAELGIDPSELEPLDGGVLHALSREGIRDAVREKLPEIRECYEGWLAQHPRLEGKLKVDFRIAEIPGRERGRVSQVTVLDGGLGHVAMEGCVRNVFKAMRFERPERGELRVTYPLDFSAGSKAP